MLRSHIIAKYNISVSTDITEKESPKMTKLFKELTQFFAIKSNTLETFINSKEPKSHAEVEYWTKYYELRGF
jgi:hypothetical protein